MPVRMVEWSPAFRLPPAPCLDSAPCAGARDRGPCASHNLHLDLLSTCAPRPAASSHRPPASLCTCTWCPLHYTADCAALPARPAPSRTALFGHPFPQTREVMNARDSCAESFSGARYDAHASATACFRLPPAQNVPWDHDAARLQRGSLVKAACAVGSRPAGEQNRAGVAELALCAGHLARRPRRPLAWTGNKGRGGGACPDRIRRLARATQLLRRDCGRTAAMGRMQLW